MSLENTHDIGNVKIVMLAGGGGGGSYSAGSGISISNSVITNIRKGALTGVVDSISGNIAHTQITGARDTFAAGALILLQSEAAGTANNLRIQYGAQSSESQTFAIYDTSSTAASVTIASGDTVIMMIDNTGYRAIILNVLSASGGSSYAGLGIGKKKTVTNNVIDTDIDLHRAPIVGDRLLIYFDEKVTNPTGLTTYNNGTAVTSGLENVTPMYINAGWNILKYDNSFLGTGWVRVQNVNTPTTLSGLSDTLINSPSDGQMLAYDNSSSKWKNKTIAPNNSGTPVRELKTLQIGDNVFDTFGLKTFDVTSVTSGTINVGVITASQLNGEIIAVHTGSNTGTTSNAWTLALNDGQTIEALTMSKGGSAYTDAITADCLLFVKCDITNSTATLLGIAGAGTTVQANPTGTPTVELNKLKIGNGVYDTSAIRPHMISSISSGSMTVHVTNLDQLNGKVIAICTESNTGTTTLAWELNLSDGGSSAGISMTNADGTDFTDEIVANELLLVYVDADNFVATVLSVVGKKDEEIKTATGNPITLTDAVAGNALEVSAEIVASQSGSGTPSPTNIRPISGFSSIIITREDAQGHTATVTVALGQTVCGGTLDLTSGELTVTHAYKQINKAGSSFYQEKVGTNATLFAWDMGNAYHGVTHGDAVVPDIISNYLPKTSAGGIWSTDASGITTKNDGTRIWLRIQGCTTASEIETYTNNNALYACWELETPVTTTLTAAQLALVKGQNTLTCNSGNMEITYKASGLDALKERVDDLEDAVADLETDMASKAEKTTIGTVESGTTASQAYAVGEHFIRNDKFCTAIVAIASGATLTLNTNYVEGTIAEALNGLSGGLSIKTYTVTVAPSDYNGMSTSSYQFAEKNIEVADMTNRKVIITAIAQTSTNVAIGYAKVDNTHLHICFSRGSVPTATFTYDINVLMI